MVSGDGEAWETGGGGRQMVVDARSIGVKGAGEGRHKWNERPGRLTES